MCSTLQYGRPVRTSHLKTYMIQYNRLLITLLLEHVEIRSTSCFHQEMLEIKCLLFCCWMFFIYKLIAYRYSVPSFINYLYPMQRVVLDKIGNITGQLIDRIG